VGTRESDRVRTGRLNRRWLQYAVGRASRLGTTAISSVREHSVSENIQQRKRNASQIEADLAATRDRLTASVETLIDQVHPNRIKQRSVDRVKKLANAEFESAKSTVFNARGDLRTDRLAVAGAAAAGFVTFLLIMRALVRRARRLPE
jgi:hypothetical protein